MGFSSTLALVITLTLFLVSKGWIPSVRYRRFSTVRFSKQETEQRIDEDYGAGVVGAEFFGGNKQKEEFYDPVAEREARIELIGAEVQPYDRFADEAAFPSCGHVAKSLQSLLNQVLYDRKEDGTIEYTYASNIQWETPFQIKSKNPLTELEQSKEFYRHLDVAVVSGRKIQEKRVEIRWEASVSWPTFWEPRVLVTGTSTLTLSDKNTITKQVDKLDSELVPSIVNQLVPRFWDIYHIGMTPSAEIAPRFEQKVSPLAGFKLYDLPPRLVLQPSIDDLGTRDDCNAGMVPNHAFSCVIKTMGPQKQRYVPATPIEVRIVPKAKSPARLKWSIPVSVECLSQLKLPVPGKDTEIDEKAQPICEYKFQQRRRVATVPYGGGPQDPEIAELRRKLYEKVKRQNLCPKLDESGRPMFFFWQNGSKACCTEEGLGMSVYEWRPEFVECNEIGIELETGEQLQLS